MKGYNFVQDVVTSVDCEPVSEKLSDLNGKLYLSVHGSDGVTYVGTNPVLTCVPRDFSGYNRQGEWKLTITLSSDGVTLKSLRDSEISGITRHI
jgi:hypothetical protein